MFQVIRLVQILTIITVALSGLLLGLGQRDLNPFIVAMVGAVSAFILVDWLRWFYLPQWLANLFAVLVTAFTVTSFFFDGDSVRQLLGVGKLLVYLQSILLFQRKSSRVYWQVLVLSLLQVVVGTVFNLGFEGGVLFIVYMLVAGSTMMMLHLYQDSSSITQRNILRRRSLIPGGLPSTLPAANDAPSSFFKSLGAVWHQLVSRSPSVRSSDEYSGSRPIAAFSETCKDRKIIGQMFGSFSVLGIGSLGFAVFLFYFLPRENSSWSGPREVDMQMAGSTKSFTLQHDDIILLSSRLVMTVTFRDSLTSQPIEINQQPYFRGIVLPNLAIEENRTTWQAAYDQIYDRRDYRSISSPRSSVNQVVQDIVLEPTEDPLLYSAIPTYRDKDTPVQYYWCWPLGGITRQKSSEKMQLAHFRYSFVIPTLPNGLFFESVPYVHRANPAEPMTPELEPGLYRWLTFLDPQRYPTIVSMGNQIVANAPASDQKNHLTIAKRMESYFLDGNRFAYSLDFRDIRRDPTIDTVEDFFANHRNGHCEYFASALTLMLRSQGIPARIVVGYRGGQKNEFGEHFDVEARHAHAWIEAYIRPQDCTNEMVASGQASSKLGAWLRLDPTPALDDDQSLLTGADDALDLAKSLWRDYVLGLQAERSTNSVTSSGIHLSGFFKVLDLDWWQSWVSEFGRGLQDPNSRWRYLQIILPVLIILLGGFATWYYRKRNSKSADSATQRKRPSFRMRLGSMLESVSPRLARLISGDPDYGDSDVPFYSRLTAMLDGLGLYREENQTQREFAGVVAGELSQKPSGGEIGRLTKQITEYYYLVRFGNRSLDDGQQQDVNRALNDLESEISNVRQVKE